MDPEQPPSSDQIAFCINRLIQDKPPEWRPDFASSWDSTTGSLQQLRTLVSSGKAFVPAAMSSAHRTSAAFRHADIAVVDVDYGLTLLQFLEHPLARQAAWAYTTANHNPEVDADRFRVVFHLPRRINNPDLYKAAVTLLSRSLGGDKSCTDPCRLFYGNSKALHPLWNPDARLDDGFMLDAEAEMSRQRRNIDHDLAEVDDHTLQRAAFVLEQIIQPTQDGQRDRFIRITAAARSAGDHLFEPWVRWASTTHHGTGKNSRQATERFFRGMKGSSLGTLFFLASEDDPDWRDKMPDELKSDYVPNRGIYGPSFAGYGYEDFLGDPVDDFIVAETGTQSLFDSERPWAQVASITPARVTTITEEDDYDGEIGEDFLDDSASWDLSDIPLSEPPALEEDDPTGRHPSSPARRGRPRNSGRQSNDIVEIRDILLARYPGLRLNVATQSLEYGPFDQPQFIRDVSMLYVTIATEATKVYAKTMVHDTAHMIGFENQYNPINAYIKRCASTAAPSPHFKAIASEFLGLPEEGILNPTMPDGRNIADVIMERFMIAAVARAMEPGCACDWMPILVGKQHSGKTHFLKYLTPPETPNSYRYPYFSTVQQGVAYLKDRPHVLHAGWIVCFDEIERLFKRQYTEELKNLISVPVDRSAPKYQNERDFPRSFVLCGATNSYSFLQDPTGNRRFLPVIVRGKVPSPRNPNLLMADLDRFKQERDALWSAAFSAYQNREPHLFDGYELSLIEGYMDSFFEDTPVENQVDRILESHFSGIHQGRYYILLSDLFKWLDVPITQQPSMTRLVTDVLKRRGWVLRRVSIRGKVNRIWLRPEGANFTAFPD